VLRTSILNWTAASRHVRCFEYLNTGVQPKFFMGGRGRKGVKEHDSPSHTFISVAQIL